MPDYEKGKIYKLWSPQGNEIYIGSTTQSLAVRKAQHKRSLKYCSRILFQKYDDVRIELIEEYPCKNKMQLDRREGEIVRNNDCVNKIIAGRTRAEYYEDNKEQINEKNREHYEKNKEKILEYYKEYYQTDDYKEKRKEYREKNKEKIREKKKEYNENNKEQIREKQKEYRENNKEKRNEYQREYYKKNKEKVLEYQREYYEKNKK